MTFDIPDRPNADFAAQSRLFSNDLQAMVQPAALTGVKTGCAVTAQVSPNMTLAVALGTIYLTGTEVPVTAGNVTITTAHGSQPRFDIVVVNLTTGAKSVVAGTPAEFPVEPLTPANSLMLAQVYVPALDTAIGPTQVKDRRIIVTMPVIVAPKDVAYYRGRTSTAGFESWYVAGRVHQEATGGTWGDSVPGPNGMLAVPFLSGRGGTLDRIQFRIQSPLAGASARVGIYDSVVSDVDFYPRNLIVDGGSQSIATSGSKTSTINVTLTPNKLYWCAFVQNAAVNQSFHYSVQPGPYLLSTMLGVDANLGSTYVSWKHAFTYGALPATFPDTARVINTAAPAIGVRYSA